MNMMRKMMFLCFTLLLILTICIPVCADDVQNALESTAEQLLKAELSYGATNGDWAAFGLVRGGYTVPDSYYENVAAYVKQCGGVLHSRKNSEYSRAVIVLTALGKDPTDVGGYNLLSPLHDYEKTVWQGINGPVWALLALDSGNYESTLRQDYVDALLEKELDGGGWALSGTEADTDITAMVLQALAKYQDQLPVREASERAVQKLSDKQNSDGTYSTMGEATCESTAQVVVALCELGIAVDDARFVKNGNSVIDGLLHYYKDGGFEHKAGSGKNILATVQGFYALTAAVRASEGKSSLYRITEREEEETLSFCDIEGHANRTAIEKLAQMQIINGKGDGTFAPDETMTRAQFCTIIVKALGLTPKANSSFSDIKPDDWFAGYVGTASEKGIVNGVGDGRFHPNGTITRQEAAVMTARAAKLLGLDTTADDAEELLLLFADGDSVSSWAKAAVAYCFENSILPDTGTVEPTRAILRSEVAQMIYNLLDTAGKI